MIAAKRRAIHSPDDPAQVKLLAAGRRAPAFTVRTPESLSRPVLLVFYRGGWYPYCNAHLGKLRTAQPKLVEMGYEVLFLSANRREFLISSLRDKDLPYPDYKARIRSEEFLATAAAASESKE